jgi:hypothetical protein
LVTDKSVLCCCGGSIQNWRWRIFYPKNVNLTNFGDSRTSILQNRIYKTYTVILQLGKTNQADFFFCCGTWGLYRNYSRWKGGDCRVERICRRTGIAERMEVL